MNNSLRALVPLALALSLAPAGTAAAQTVAPPTLVYPDGPITHTRHLVYHWTTRTLTADVTRPVNTAREFSSTSCFDNTRTPGIWSLFDLLHDDIVDWGVKTCSETNVLTRFTFGYNTVALDPGLGGPGAAMEFALYEGTNGFGDLGEEIARFSFTGLPGSPVAGQQNPYPLFVTVDLVDEPLVVPDGNIGWSFMNTDNKSGPLLCFAPNASLGTRDALDVYRPGPATNGHYSGTFHWSSAPVGSFYLSIEEADDDDAAGSTVVNGSGFNPVLLSQLSAPVIGAHWIAHLDMSGYPSSPASVVVFSPTAIPPFMTSWGEALLDPLDPGAVQDIGYTLHSMPIPLLPELAGVIVHTQGAIFLGGGVLVLTNGIDLTLGW